MKQKWELWAPQTERSREDVKRLLNRKLTKEDLQRLLARKLTRDDAVRALRCALPVLIKAALALLLAALCVQSFYQSMCVGVTFTHRGVLMEPEYYRVGFWLLVLFFLTVSLLFRRAPIAAGVAFLLLQTIAVINYYELMFRGTVFTWRDIYSFRTAADVIGNYRFPLNDRIGFILLAALLALLITVLLSRLHIPFRRNYLLAALSLLLLVYSGAQQLRNVPENVWTWENLYYKRGWIVGTLHNLREGHVQIREPEGYDAGALPEAEGAPGTAAAYPDIVFVLDETYYDLRRLLDFDADENAMRVYDGLDACKGFAAVPLVGGGTNDSEYELLTGNSISLLNNYSPFSNLSFRDCCSVVSYLEQAGYATMAAHPALPANYHRGTVWRQLGFDAVYFLEDFTETDGYGERDYITDSAAFADFRRFYEAMPEAQPRFAYLLTIQNHGDWDRNPPEADTVHVPEEIGISDAETVSEYLSCIQRTDAFIRELTDYFAACGRPVIVYMVGDHAPSFAIDYHSGDADDQALFLTKRQVPYFIWANYDADLGAPTENRDIDLCALTPRVLRAAGLPLSPYYNQLLRLAETTVCFTNVIPPETGRFGESLGYIRTDGGSGSMGDGSPEGEALADYLYMEYNGIGDKSRQQRLFDPPG